MGNGAIYIGDNLQEFNEGVLGITDPAAYTDDSGILNQPGVDALLAGSAINPTISEQRIYSAYVSDVLNILPELSAMASLRVDHFVNEDSDEDLAKWVASYTPDLNYTGSDEIKFKVTNPDNPNSEGLSDEATILISINPVNDAPSITDVEDQNVTEDIASTIVLDYNDPDSDISVAVSSSNSDNVSVSLDGSNLTITPSLNYNGESTISIIVSEVGGEYQATESFNVSITAVNDTPTLSTIEAVAFNEDGSTNDCNKLLDQITNFQ